MSITKEEWLKNIRDYEPPPKETVTLAEYEMLPKLAKWKCPINRNPLFCDGHDCPTNMETLDTYENECRKRMRARIKLMKILKGWIKIETSRKPQLGTRY